MYKQQETNLVAVATILIVGARELAIDLNVDLFLEYLLLLAKWNRVYNLTAVHDLAQMATRHILDSLAVIPWLKGNLLLDVGSGAGLPGIPLALYNPDNHVFLIDSNGKKIRFLQEVKRLLSLKNLEIIHSRVESYQSLQKFDSIISRAFGNLTRFVDYTMQLIKTDGIWLAMKGQPPLIECSLIDRPIEIIDYKVPGLIQQRCLVIMRTE